MIGMTTLSSLPRLRDCTSHRISTYDVTGGNADYWSIQPGETRTLGEIEGAGCIKHIWMTLGIPQEDYTRRIVLRMFWEGAKQPSVECPIGDFFGLGHGRRKNFVTVPLQMSPQSGKGFNSYWPMPFSQHARIEVENQGDQAYAHYFYLDYERYPEPEPNLAYFHVQWRRENPATGWGDQYAKRGADRRQLYEKLSPDTRWSNLDGKENYAILEATGNGVYCGAHLDLDVFERQKNDWYGEGDDMVFIDGEPWPPSLHGTGTEDWFNCAYCPREEYNGPYHGVILYSGTDQWPWKGKQTVYRYHIEDPLRFRKSILVSIEHGHANKLTNDYSSTAYYYLSRPKRGGPKLPPVEKRVPRADEPEYEGGKQP